MDVTVLGRVGYDLYADQEGVPLKDVTSFSRYVGGSSANIAVGMARLGLQVGIISCIGRDALGDYLVEYLDGEGIDTLHVQWSDSRQSSLCLTEVSPPDSFPQVFYRQQAADIAVTVDLPERQMIEESRLFITNGTSLCGSPSRESTYRCLEWAHQAGTQVAFDVDYRSMSWESPRHAGLFARLALPFVDIFIANPEELLLVSERSDPSDAVKHLLELGVSVIAAKMGNEGTWVCSLTESLFLPPYPVEVTSTIGAGDGFAAGFLYGLASGLSLSESLQYGNATAALVVTRPMCSEAMPRLEEVQRLIAENREIRPESRD